MGEDHHDTKICSHPALAARTDVAAIAAERFAEIPRLKPFAIVAGEFVRIGDLVENAGAVADIAIFRSPDIGSTGTVPTAEVLEAVGQHDLLIVDATGIRAGRDHAGQAAPFR